MCFIRKGCLKAFSTFTPHSQKNTFHIHLQQYQTLNKHFPHSFLLRSIMPYSRPLSSLVTVSTHHGDNIGLNVFVENTMRILERSGRRPVEAVQYYEKNQYYITYKSHRTNYPETSVYAFKPSSLPGLTTYNQRTWCPARSPS